MTVFVVTGRLGGSLTISKVLPLIHLPGVEKVVVFCQEASSAVKGVEYVELPKWVSRVWPCVIARIMRHVVEPLQLIRYALRLRPPYIVGFYTLPKGLYSVIAARVIGAQSIVAVIGGKHEIEKPYLPMTPLWRTVNLLLLHATDHILTKGQKDNNFLNEHGIRSAKIDVFNGAIDTSRFTHNGDVEKDIDLLFVGTFSTLKGPDRVLDAVQKLKVMRPDVCAVFVGDGALYPAVAARIEMEGLAGNVQLVGFQPDPAPYFRRAKVLLMPSRSEGLSTAMLEAMACGCVPIVSDVGNQSEAAHHMETAAVVGDYLAVDDFASHARRLLEDESLRARLARNAQRLIDERYSVQAQARELARVFRKLDSNRVEARDLVI